MIVHSKSNLEANANQKLGDGILLINHPRDCPSLRPGGVWSVTCRTIPTVYGRSESRF
jgi:hypothetical protein